MTEVFCVLSAVDNLRLGYRVTSCFTASQNPRNCFLQCKPGTGSKKTILWGQRPNARRISSLQGSHLTLCTNVCHFFAWLPSLDAYSSYQTSVLAYHGCSCIDHTIKLVVSLMTMWCNHTPEAALPKPGRRADDLSDLGQFIKRAGMSSYVLSLMVSLVRQWRPFPPGCLPTSLTLPWYLQSFLSHSRSQVAN